MITVSKLYIQITDIHDIHITYRYWNMTYSTWHVWRRTKREKIVIGSSALPFWDIFIFCFLLKKIVSRTCVLVSLCFDHVFVYWFSCFTRFEHYRISTKKMHAMIWVRRFFRPCPARSIPGAAALPRAFFPFRCCCFARQRKEHSARYRFELSSKKRLRKTETHLLILFLSFSRYTHKNLIFYKTNKTNTKWAEKVS